MAIGSKHMQYTRRRLLFGSLILIQIANPITVISKHPLNGTNDGYSKSYQSMIMYDLCFLIFGGNGLFDLAYTFLHFGTTGCGHTCCIAQPGLSRRWRAGHHRSYSSKLHGLHSLAQQHYWLVVSTTLKKYQPVWIILPNIWENMFQTTNQIRF